MNKDLVTRLMQQLAVDDNYYAEMLTITQEVYSEPEFFDTLEASAKITMQEFFKELDSIKEYIAQNKVSEVIVKGLLQHYSEGDIIKVCNMLEDTLAIVKNYEATLDEKLKIIGGVEFNVSPETDVNLH